MSLSHSQERMYMAGVERGVNGKRHRAIVVSFERSTGYLVKIRPESDGHGRDLHVGAVNIGCGLTLGRAQLIIIPVSAAGNPTRREPPVPVPTYNSIKPLPCASRVLPFHPLRISSPPPSTSVLPPLRLPPRSTPYALLSYAPSVWYTHSHSFRVRHNSI